MAVHIHESLVEFAQHDGHRVQHLIEGRLDVRLIGGEGDVGRHVENDVVAMAGDRYAGALEAFAQLSFLVVHVEADAAARQCTEACANQHGLAGLYIGGRAEEGACGGAEKGAGACADGGVGNLLLAGIGIGRAGGEQEGCGGQGDDGVFHGVPGNGWACIRAVVAGLWLMKGLLGSQRGFVHQEAAGLAFPEIGIEAVALEQLLVGAFLHDAALVHDDQAVHGGNG